MLVSTVAFLNWVADKHILKVFQLDIKGMVVVQHDLIVLLRNLFQSSEFFVLNFNFGDLTFELGNDLAY